MHTVDRSWSKHPKAVEAAKLHQVVQYLYGAVAPDRYPWTAAYHRRLIYQRVIAKELVRYYKRLQVEYGSTASLVKLAMKITHHPGVSKPGKVGRQKADPHAVAAMKLLLEQRSASVKPDGVVKASALAARDATIGKLKSLGIPIKVEKAELHLEWVDVVETFRRLFPSMAEEIAATLQAAAGTHAEDLAVELIQAADPNNPLTIQQAITTVRNQVDGITRRRAERIARTTTAQVYGQVADEVMRRNGIPSRRWLTAAASPAALTKPVCIICLSNSLQGWVPMDHEFMSGHRAPPAHPNCLIGSSHVLAERITSTYKRWYDGIVVRIMTDKHDLTVTPNHPILTSRRWVGAGMLHVGDYVVCHQGTQWEVLINPNGQNGPTTIEQVVESFGKSSQVSTMKVPVAGPDFHGDGVGSQVAVIRSNRLLRDDFDPTLCEHHKQSVLQSRVESARSLNTFSTSGQALSGSMASTSSGVSRFSLPLSLSDRETRPLQDFGSGSVTGINMKLQQTFADGTSINSEKLSTLIFGSPGQIELVQLREVQFLPFHGWVYNLETENGWYIAESIITHNCRCDVAANVENWLPDMEIVWPTEEDLQPETPEYEDPTASMQGFVVGSEEEDQQNQEQTDNEEE